MKARFSSLKSIEQLDTLFEKSDQEPVLIFKHSNTCSISGSVYSSVSDFDLDVNLVTVQNSREISKAIAERIGVRHESPQALVVRDNACVYHASHFDIDPEKLLEKLR